MAEGRILSKRVTRSDKVASLSSDTARMIYSWLIPYLDVEGRMEADPRLLKADIAPLLDHITPKVIHRVLKELHEVGLIILYDNDRYLQVCKFEENQRNLRKDREAPSRIPEPSDELRTNSGVAPDKLPYKLREDKRREVKDKGAIAPAKDKYLEVVFLKKEEYEKLCTKYSKPLTDKAIEILNNAIQSKGYSYKSHYHALLGWPMERAKEGSSGNGQATGKQKESPFTPCPKCKKEVLKTDIVDGYCFNCGERGQIPPEFKSFIKEVPA